MSKRTFIQQAARSMMNNPKVLEQSPDKWIDLSIQWAERLWQRLDERGYGNPKEGQPKEKRHWYTELQDQERFDRAWAKYGREGGRDAAAKAWTLLSDAEKEHIEYSIPKYLDQLHSSGKAKAHLSTWLNERRWESFDMVTQKAKPKLAVVDNGEVLHLQKMIAMTKDENTKKALESQLSGLRSKAEAAQ